MKYRVVSPRFVGAEVGDIIALDPDKVNIKALVKAGTVVAVPAKARKVDKKIVRKGVN